MLKGLFSRRPPARPDPAPIEVFEAVDEVRSWGLFDPAWYVHRYPDVAGFDDPLVHYCTYGLGELRDPSPHVSPATYMRRNPQARAASLPALLRALAAQGVADRDAAWTPDDDATLEYLLRRHRLFDEQWYLARNRDVARSELTPIQHFIRYGMFELRDPGPAFDSEFYSYNHPDYRERSRTPAEHFVRIGIARGHAGVEQPKYDQWVATFDALTPEDLDRLRAEAAALPPAVAVHVVTAEAVGHFERVAGAWRGQIGCRVRFVRGAGVGDDAWARCAALIGTDPAFSQVRPEEAVADLPAGTVAVLCGGDALPRPHAAYVLARILGQSGAAAAYADHDHIDEAGARAAPVFKPAMSPEFMRRLPYAGPVMAAVVDDGHRDRLAAAVTAAAAGDADAAWAAYLLGLPPAAVARAPFVLFHLLGDPPPGAPSHEPVPAPGVAREARSTSDADAPTASVIIPTRDRRDLLEACIDSIDAQTLYPAGRLAILVVDNGSTEEATLAYLAELAARPDVTVVPSPGPFNFSKICNDGAAAASGDVLVFLNNDTTVRRRDWLLALVEHARKPDVGVVGARLLYPDGTVQHGGVVLGVQGVGAHRLPEVDGETAERVDVTREMVAVTGACLAVRRRVFAELGGFDTTLQVAFNDANLCVDAFKAGYRNMYVAEALLFHHESRSRGLDDSRAKQLRNAREAIYIRERHGALFRDDPTYSPNLSLKRVGDIAYPPRVVRPWRRPPDARRRVLLLSQMHAIGSGVATVLEQQALFLRDRGWDVTVGGPLKPPGRDYPGCRRADLRTAEAAAAYAVAEAVDCVIAHTPPFFSIVRFLGARPPAYFVDHGEPTPRLFPDAQLREDVDWEKRFCAPLARRVFAISDTIRRHQYRADAIVLRNGNSHLAAWSGAWAGKRRALREDLGFAGCFVVLNVCRFGSGERSYKGIGRYGEVASDAPFLHPELGGRVRFVLAGRGDPADVAEVRATGLSVVANPSDADLTDLYAASDLYLNLSEWEGYNLGIGQALAMGLDVVASDIEAHREFGVETPTGIPDLCAAVARRFAGWDEGAAGRRARVEPWDVPLTRLAETIEGDVGADRARWL